MANLLYANNAAGTLAAGITNASATLTLNPGQAALFPNPGPGQAFYGTLTDAATQSLIEIVLATAVSGNIISITRAQDGTSALSWNAGDIFSQRVVAAELRAFSTLATGNLVNVQTFAASGTYTPTAGANQAIVRAIAPGAAGGGTSATGVGQCAAGGGGGAGGFGELYIPEGALTTTAVTIGLPGAGVVGGNGGNGGNVSFGAALVCAGGSGGSNGGAGSGSIGGFNSGQGGGGGNCTGTGIITVNGRGATGGIGVGFTTGFVQNGVGASSQWGSGGDAFVSSNARGFGGGGVGAGVGQSSAASAGFAGAPGILIVYEYA